MILYQQQAVIVTGQPLELYIGKVFPRDSSVSLQPGNRSEKIRITKQMKKISLLLFSSLLMLIAVGSDRGVDDGERCRQNLVWALWA